MFISNRDSDVLILIKWGTVMKQVLGFVGALTLLLLQSFAINAKAYAQDSNKDLSTFNECVDAVLLGPTKDKLKVFGHQMNCKKARLRYLADDDSIWVAAIISMHRAAHSDPQTLLSFHVLSDGTTSHIEYFITPEKASGWTVEGYKNRSEIQQWRRGWSDRNVGVEYSVGLYIAREVAARVSDSRFRALANMNTGELEYYIDRPGGDMSRTPVDGGPRDCMWKCYQNNACLAWTWVQPGVQEDKAVCWLKRSTQGQHVRFNPDTVSGLKSAYVLME